jgi:hypothetical protein|tara:strand:+ start:833 stop:970 length:138 start_codon:yes stop_codon:yes gene_type:complete
VKVNNGGGAYTPLYTSCFYIAAISVKAEAIIEYEKKYITVGNSEF